MTATDILLRLRAAIHLASARLAPQTSPEIELMREAAEEIERMREALGHCRASEDGEHLWAMFSTGPDGRIDPAARHGSAAAFCHRCRIPWAPYLTPASRS